MILTLNCGSRAEKQALANRWLFSSSRVAGRASSHPDVGNGSKLTQRVTQVCREAGRSACGHERAFAEPFGAQAGTYRCGGRERLGGGDASDGESGKSSGGLHDDFLKESCAGRL